MFTTQKKVKGYIDDMGWSLVTAAKRADLPVATIKSIIYGKSSNQKLSTLEKLAKAFGCNIDDLIHDNTAKAHDFQGDDDLLRECIDVVEMYLSKNKITLSKERTVKVVDSLLSLNLKKRSSNNKYVTDDDTIEWIIENHTA